MEENKKGMSFLVKCENCKKNFKITDENMEHKKEFKSNGRSIFLTYYDCPECGKRHLVQIDDETSLQELSKITTEFYKLAIMKRKGKQIPKKQLEKFKKARQHLSDYRMNLMKEFTGKIATDETGAEYELRFSI